MFYFRKHKSFIFIPFILVCILSSWLYFHTNDQINYQGLPPVACIDGTKLILQNFPIHLNIFENNQPYMIPDTIGHDPGNCLRVIHTNNNSGFVFITANDKKNYTLEDFFNVWHKTYPYLDTTNQNISIFVENKKVTQIRPIILQPYMHITIFYTTPL